jgi:hypothetical protein
MANWTYADLKAALAPHEALSDAAAAAVLAAETVAVQGALERNSAILRFIRANIWGRIQVRASRPWNATASINAETAAARQVIDAVTLFDTFDLSDPTLYAALARDLDALVALGDVTAGQRAAILAVRDGVAPRWQPAPTAGDVQTARRQP